MNMTMLIGGFVLVAVGLIPPNLTRRFRERSWGRKKTTPKDDVPAHVVAAPTSTTDAPQPTDAPRQMPARSAPPAMPRTTPTAPNVNFLRSLVGKKPKLAQDQGPIGAPSEPDDEDDAAADLRVVATEPDRPRNLVSPQTETPPVETPAVAVATTIKDAAETERPVTAAIPTIPFTLATTLTRTPFEPAPRRTTQEPDTSRMPSWLREAYAETPVDETSRPKDPDDEDDVLDSTSIFGGVTASTEERARWQQELAEEEAERQAVKPTEDQIQSPPGFVAQHSFAPPVVAPEPVAVPVVEATASPSDPDVEDSEIATTWQWIQFLGEDVQTLGTAERENLIRMIAEMHDDDMLPVLVKAFGEEQADGLRFEVLKAVMTFEHPIVAELIAYVKEHGTDKERSYVESCVES